MPAWRGDPSVKDGAALISTELLTALNRTRLPDASRRVITAIITASYAWKHPDAILRMRELEQLTNLPAPRIAKARQDLADRRMLTWHAGPDRLAPTRYTPNPAYAEWADAPDAPGAAREIIHRRRPMVDAPLFVSAETPTQLNLGVSTDTNLVSRETPIGVSTDTNESPNPRHDADPSPVRREEGEDLAPNEADTPPPRPRYRDIVRQIHAATTVHDDIALHDLHHPPATPTARAAAKADERERQRLHRLAKRLPRSPVTERDLPPDGRQLTPGAGLKMSTNNQPTEETTPA